MNTWIENPASLQVGDPRQNGIHALMEITGASYETLDVQSWDEHNLLWQLHLAGNEAMAKKLAQNAQAMTENKVIRNLLLKSAIWRINEDEHLEKLTNIDPNVIIFVRIAIAKDKTGWEQQWQNEMKQLDE